MSFKTFTIYNGSTSNSDQVLFGLKFIYDIFLIILLCLIDIEIGAGRPKRIAGKDYVVTELERETKNVFLVEFFLTNNVYK